jgi:SAM-dependent methyltransferase
MPTIWLDPTTLSFNTLLLLERVQLSWLPGGVPEPELAVALAANPVVAWYLRHKCPELAGWLDRLPSPPPEADPAAIRPAEVAVLRTLDDLLTYVLDPAIYDAQPFLGWDSRELTALADWAGATVLDVGAGTGRLAFTVAAAGARAVFAVEPVANLRDYMRQKARALAQPAVYPVDGLLTDLPFPDAFADHTVCGHAFGDAPAAEYAELHRVTRPGGLIILCPGNVDQDNEIHHFLLAQGFQWGRFHEPERADRPRNGWKRKYWKQV